MRKDQDAPWLREVVAGLLEARDVRTVWETGADALEELGLHKLIYGATHIPTWGIIGDGQDALILYRGPQSYADIYLGEELYRASVTYEWAAQNSGFASWAEVAATRTAPPGPAQLRIIDLNIRHGCFAGFVGSLNDVVPGMRGVIGLSPGNGMMPPEADALWAEVGESVQMICRLMHLRIGALPQTPQRRPLTSRQREALTWCAQGKTVQDIATIMELSKVTVEKHLRLAREALDAHTTAHAVQKATSLNLLSVPV